MSHDRGQFHEGLHAAEALGDLEDAQAGQNAPRLGQTASNFEGHHAAEAIHLGCGNVVSGVVGETGIVNPPHTRLLF